MTANVYRDPATVRSVMSSEYRNAAETIFVPLMQRAGIKSINVKKITVALGTKTVPEVTYFCDMPADMRAFSLMAQTPLAEMLSLFGIVKIEIQASEEECASLKNTYEALVNAMRTAGSADSGDGGVAKEESKVEKKAAGNSKVKSVCKQKCCRKIMKQPK